MLAVTLLLLGVISFCVGELETIGEPVRELQVGKSALLHIFTDHQFTKRGKVGRWSFYARQKGTFFAGVWRPADRAKSSKKGHDVKQWMLVNATEIRVKSTGKHDYWIPFPERIQVKPGDAIGLHYPKGYDKTMTIVAAFEGKRKQSDLDGVPMSEVTVQSQRQPSLVPGETVVPAHPSWRKTAIALEAHTMEDAGLVRFYEDTYSSFNVGGDHIAETGIVELKVSGLWGTVCDTRSHNTARMADAWGNRVCKMLNPAYVMGHAQNEAIERTDHMTDHNSLMNANCRDDVPLELCSMDLASIRSKPCPVGVVKRITCLPDPDKYNINMRKHIMF